MFFSQENTIFKFNLLGLTIDEIIALEGPFDSWKEFPLDVGDLISRLKEESFDIGQYFMENSYIRSASYDINRNVLGYRANIGFDFTENGICIGCRYILFLPNNSDINEHLLIFNNVLNYFIELYNQRIRILEMSERKYIFELDNI